MKMTVLPQVHFHIKQSRDSFQVWKIKAVFWDFPGCAVVKNPSANTAIHGFEPQLGKIPHAHHKY